MSQVGTSQQCYRAGAQGIRTLALTAALIVSCSAALTLASATGKSWIINPHPCTRRGTTPMHKEKKLEGSTVLQQLLPAPGRHSHGRGLLLGGEPGTITPHDYDTSPDSGPEQPILQWGESGDQRTTHLTSSPAQLDKVLHVHAPHSQSEPERQYNSWHPCEGKLRWHEKSEKMT